MKNKFGKANTLGDTMLIKEPNRTPLFDPATTKFEKQNIQLTIPSFKKQKTEMLVNPLKQKSLEEERQDSEIMPGISEIDSRDHPSA